MSKNHRNSFLLVVTICVGGIAAPSESIVAGPVQTVVALRGAQAPGYGPGITYNAFDVLPTINNLGQVAFEARVDGLGINVNTINGLWTGTPNAIIPAALGFNHAPGTAGDTKFSSISNVRVNDAGEVAFSARLWGNDVSESNNFGIWAGSPGATNYVARISDLAPGIPGAAFSPQGLHQPAFNNAGAVAFSAIVSGGGINDSNSSGIWVGLPGALSVAARAGSRAPGMPAGINYGYNSGSTPIFLEPSLSNSGGIALNASMIGPGITTANDRGIWAGQPGLLSQVAREGDAAPGTGASVAYRTLDQNVTTNSSGQVAFSGSLIGTGVTNSNDMGIWTGAPGTVQLLAREGDQAPGTAVGVHFGTFIGVSSTEFVPSLSENGETAFLANLLGPGISNGNSTGLWSGMPGNLELILREGQQAPDSAPGVLLAGVDPSSLSINSIGDLAFVAGVTGAADFRAIFASMNGQLHLIAKTGDQIDVGGGVLRTLTDLRLYGGVAEGFGSGWNDSGQLTYKATFAGGSSAIVVTAVPEPASALLLLVGGTLLRVSHSIRHRRRGELMTLRGE